MERAWWAQVFFCEFIRHYRKLDDAAIVADVKQSMDDLEDKIPGEKSFGSKMVQWAEQRIVRNYESRGIHGRKGGRPRKQKEMDALASQPKSPPATSSGNGEALNDEGATAPAGQFFEARETSPGAQPLSASGQVSALDRHPGAQLESASGESFDQGQPAKRADAHARKDWDASATVRAQNFGGDAATREGAEAVISGFATSPSEFQNQKRPGKSANPSVENSIQGGSERGDGGLPIPADQKGEGGLLTAPSPTPPLGILKNVRISPEQLRRYRAEYGDPTRLIDALSTYIAKTGKRYKNHFAALVSWARREIESGIDPETGSKADQLSRIRFAARAAGIDAFSGKRIDFATGEVIEPEAESPGEIPYNPLELGEAE